MARLLLFLLALGVLRAPVAGAAPAACAGGVFTGNGATLRLDVAARTAQVAIDGCATTGTGRVRAKRRATIVTATLPSPGCEALGLGGRPVAVRVILPSPGCDAATVRLRARRPAARVELALPRGAQATTTTTVPVGGTTTTTLTGSPGFAAVVAPALQSACAGCHGAASPAAGLDLRASVAWSALVNVASTQQPAVLRVVPGVPASSYLMRKIDGVPGTTGGAMPMSPTAAAAVRAWILAGAPND